MSLSSQRSEPDRWVRLDWIMVRLMPVLGFAALLIPVGAWALNAVMQARGMSQEELDVLQFWCMGVTIVYWSLFMTALVACSLAWAFTRGKSWLFTSTRSHGHDATE